MATRLRIKGLLLGLALAPVLASAQFDTGGGDIGNPWDSFKLNKTTRITLNFENASPDAIIKLLEKASGITIVKDPTLTKGISVTSAKPVSLSDAFNIFSQTLSLNGYSLSKSGSLLVIRGQNQGRGNGGFGTFDPSVLQGLGGDQGTQHLDLRVFYIQYANASQLAKVVNDVFAPSGQTNNSPFQQMQFGGRGGRGGGRFGGGNQGANPLAALFGQTNNNSNLPNVRASSDDFSNSVIVNAPTALMDQVAEIIGKLDKQTDDPQTAQVYHLVYASATVIAPTIQNVLTANAPKGKGGVSGQNVDPTQRFQQALRFGSAQAAFGTVVADDRTNSLVVTATPDNQKLVYKVITDLDTEMPIQSTVYVFPLNNAKATDIATLFQSTFGTKQGVQNTNANRTSTTAASGNARQAVPNRSSTGSSGSTNRPTGLSGEVVDPNDPNMLDLPTDPNGDLMTSIGVAQGGGFGQLFRGGAGGTTGQQNQQEQPTVGLDQTGKPVNIRSLDNQITVIPDPNTNSLIISTAPGNIDLVKNILDQLDKVPPQVMIKTLIVETSLDKSDQAGFENKFSSAKIFGEKGSTGVGSINFGLASASPALQGLDYTLSAGDLSLFMNALTTDTRFNILSTPTIFTSNNSQAQINISQSIPYILSTTVDATTGAQSFNYAFEDVGIVLTVTPHITSNGYVTMDVDQSANDLQGYTSFNAPIVNQRTASTTVSVKTGETIVLGGIIRNQVTSTVNKIPILGDIPILGQLFRSTTKDNQKTELMVFLTPQVIRNDDDAKGLKDSTIKGMTPDAQKTLKNAIPPSTGDAHKSPPPGP